MKGKSSNYLFWLVVLSPLKNMTSPVGIIIPNICLKKNIYLLVGGFNHLEKYESMGRMIPYMENKVRV